jgi:hypothetical protein
METKGRKEGMETKGRKEGMETTGRKIILEKRNRVEYGGRWKDIVIRKLRCYNLYAFLEEVKPSTSGNLEKVELPKKRIGRWKKLVKKSSIVDVGDEVQEDQEIEDERMLLMKEKEHNRKISAIEELIGPLIKEEVYDVKELVEFSDIRHLVWKMFDYVDKAPTQMELTNLRLKFEGYKQGSLSIDEYALNREILEKRIAFFSVEVQDAYKKKCFIDGLNGEFRSVVGDHVFDHKYSYSDVKNIVMEMEDNQMMVGTIQNIMVEKRLEEAGVNFVQVEPGPTKLLLKDIRCYVCNEMGHYASSCPEMRAFLMDKSRRVEMPPVPPKIDAETGPGVSPYSRFKPKTDGFSR